MEHLHLHAAGWLPFQPFHMLSCPSVHTALSILQAHILLACSRYGLIEASSWSAQIGALFSIVLHRILHVIFAATQISLASCQDAWSLSFPQQISQTCISSRSTSSYPANRYTNRCPVHTPPGMGMLWDWHTGPDCLLINDAL